MEKRMAPLSEFKPWIVFGLVIVAAILLPASTALADTYVVDMTADDAGATACTPAVGDCSLRGAVTRANLNPGRDRIVLGSRIYDLTLLGLEDENKTGDLDILAAGGDLRIEGDGAGRTIINGGWATYGAVSGIDRVLHIDPGESGKMVVEVIGVAIQYGYAGTYGGGIYIGGNGTVSVTNSAIMSNTVTLVGTSGGGGGVFNQQATLSLRNTDVMSNTARGVTVGSGVGGGGILLGNTAVMNLTNGTVAWNQATGIPGMGSSIQGGGLANVHGAANVHGSTFRGNRASGGINGSLGSGGGIYNARDGRLTLDEESVVADNWADMYGGGIANVDAIAAIDRTTLSGNTVTGGEDGAAARGGAIYNDVGSVEVSRSTLQDNEAVTLEGPDRLGQGGGIANDAGTVGLVDTVLQTSYADGSCGGILNEGGGRLTIEGGLLSLNEAGGSGGGICNYQSTVTLTDHTLTLNMAQASGGGLSGVEDEMWLSRCMISGNKAYGGDGGGIYDALGTVQVKDSTLYANRAQQSGGGLHVHGGTVYLTRSTLFDNLAEEWPGGPLTINNGGGISLRIATAHVVNSTLSGNQAEESGGGAYSEDSVLSLSHTTVAGNIADTDRDGHGDGGGVFGAATGTLAIVNTILGGNADGGGEAPECGGLTLSGSGDNIIQDRTGCSIAGGTTWALDPRLDPLGLNGGPTETHALLAGSPALDAVTNGCQTYLGETLATDQRGVARPKGTACDIGSYEGALYRLHLPLVLRDS
jgi:hypothetical protein